MGAQSRRPGEKNIWAEVLREREWERERRERRRKHQGLRGEEAEEG